MYPKYYTGNCTNHHNFIQKYNNLNFNTCYAVDNFFFILMNFVKIELLTHIEKL